MVSWRNMEDFKNCCPAQCCMLLCVGKRRPIVTLRIDISVRSNELLVIGCFSGSFALRMIRG